MYQPTHGRLIHVGVHIQVKRNWHAKNQHYPSINVRPFKLDYQQIGNLEGQFQALHIDELYTPTTIEAFEMLKIQARQLQPVKLVPVHVDPNTKNILLTGDTLCMVGWDDITLSDPMRDAGQLLWWYVARKQWNEFFASYGLQLDEVLIKRIYWWAARTSFAIALWDVEHSYNWTPFLQDFVAAIHGESNPHAVFR